MKLNRNSAIARLLDPKFLNEDIEDYCSELARKSIQKYPEFTEIYEEIISVENEQRKFIRDIKNYKVLVLSEKSHRNLSSYKVPKNIRIDVLKTLPNRKYFIQVTKHLIFKYEKSDTYLRIMMFDQIVYKTLPYISIDLISGKVTINAFLATNLQEKNTDEQNTDEKKLIEAFSIPSYEENTNFIISTDNTITEEFYAQFMVLITYIELTDVTLDICYSNTKRGHILKGNDLKNELPFNVIQVNTNWNTTITYIGNSFQVKGHWRLQPYGSGRANYKYIFIDTFEKTGIIKRNAGKELPY